MTIEYWNMKARVVIPLHGHVYEMIVNIRGQPQLTVGNACWNRYHSYYSKSCTTHRYSDYGVFCY